MRFYTGQIKGDLPQMDIITAAEREFGAEGENIATIAVTRTMPSGAYAAPRPGGVSEIGSGLIAELIPATRKPRPPVGDPHRLIVLSAGRTGRPAAR